MKLNKKGFAFSTMLYGSITIIAVLMYLILSTNKASVDTTYYYKEEIIKKLNECVNEEVALEDCYASGSTTCSSLAYHSCLGINDNPIQKGTIISEIIKGTAIINNQNNLYINPYTSSNANDGLYMDPYQSGRFIYYGNNPNNFITFSGKTWRIISVEPGGYLKLIDINKYATIPWDIQGNGTWGSNSTLFSALNNNYVSSITDSTMIYPSKWKATVIYPSLQDNFNINNLVELEENTLNDSSVFGSVGLLSLSDYLKATINNTCRNNIFGENTHDCYSWLTQYNSWLLDINGELGSESEGYTYYIGNEEIQGVTYYNKILSKRTNLNHDVYPVIYLDRNAVHKGGSGTMADPYTLK